VNLWLAQTQAPDLGGWTITTFIALAGAVISLATLVVTTWAAGQRERAKWARETLAQAFFDFVDVSYSAATAARQLHEGMRHAEAAPGRTDAQMTLDERMSELLYHLTRIRLLAPTNAVSAAKQVRWAHKRAYDELRSRGEQMTADEFAPLLHVVADRRKDVIRHAKKAMSLP
jgi:hypothetical protein